MTWTRLTIRRAKLLSQATLALGLWIAPTIGAMGLERPCRPSYQCPPGWRYQQSAPQVHSEGAMPGQPVAPSTDPAAPATTDPMAPQAADANAQQPQAPQQNFNDAPSSSRASLAPGADTPQLGRLDFANRLNLFDNMTAAPQTKVWFGYQQSSGIQTGSFIIDEFGVQSFDSSTRQANYRFGAEVALFCDFSIAVQGQYYDNLSDDEFEGNFSQPQILAKYVVARDCDTILSATFGIQPETSVEEGDFQEKTTRLYPGMLYYETLTPELFTQGGFQFGIPTDEDGIDTFDWSVSLGYWLYRDCNANCCCSSSWITGIIPQVGILGKHVLGDNTIRNAYGFSDPIVMGPPGLVVPSSSASERTSVLDLSVGGLIIVDQNIQVGLGYSLPITSAEVRESEFISYVNYVF